MFQLKIPVFTGLLALSLAAETPRVGIQACLAHPDYGLKGLDGEGLGYGIHGVMQTAPQHQIRLRLDHLEFPATDFPQDKPPTRIQLQSDALGLEGLYVPFPQEPRFYSIAGLAVHRWTTEARTATGTQRGSSTRLGIGLGLGWQFSRHLAAEGRYLIIGSAEIPTVNPAWSAFTTMNTTQLGLTWTF